MWSLLLCTRLIITDSQPARDELDALDTQSFPQGARRALSWRQRQPRSYIPTQAEVQEGNKQRDALRQEYKHLVNAENLPPRPGRAGRGKTRLGLCLTGQLERLEIESKARHLVRDLNRTHDIDVVLVVANGTARYVNGFSVANSSAVQATAERLRSRTRAALIRTFVQAGASRVVLNTEPQWELPYLRKQYVLNLNKPMSNVHLANRARSHVRQWRSLWNCYKEFSALAQKAGQRYDVLAKFRDDLLIFDKVEALHERSVYENAVVTQECLSWRGINDKLAVLDARHGLKFFTSPLWVFFFDRRPFLDMSGNPETFLFRALRAGGIHTRRPLSWDKVPAVSSRTGLDGSTCVPLINEKVGIELRCVPRKCNVLSFFRKHACPWRLGANLTVQRSEEMWRMFRKLKEEATRLNCTH